ncbi:MAG: 23S rRNA (guanosine(2251)-2'-O)-methyltransferase RlmB [Clostridia bacterium]|nr:23S rRNA (guanosine(2251)-2'-O)-methyltransferase RlmB [Clostridia bacterium]
MSNDNDRRRPRSGNRPQGAGRRVYPDAAGGAPRVGRIARDVPRARRVDAEGDFTERDDKPYIGNGHGRNPRRESVSSSSSRLTPHSQLHRGSAYRAPTGPQPYKRDPDAPRGDAIVEAPENENLLAGRNPIREALRAGRPVEKLLVASGELSGAAQEIIRLARESGAVVQQVERSRLDQIYPAHQGMLAYVAAVPYVELSDMLAAAAAKGEDPFLLLLDGITDPHNLGAIVRTAECAGAHGVVIPERRAAGLTPAAAKAAAGALNHMPIARVKNLNRAIEELKAQNIWVIGTAMDGENALTADFTGPVALVIGSEGEGVSRLTLEKCDRTVSLPMLGQIESLNASVAAGILMYEVVRARAK